MPLTAEVMEKMEENKLGETLRKLRGDKTLQKAAADLGISTSALTMYEIGKRIPRDEIKVRIAKYYGVGIDIFFANA